MKQTNLKCVILALCLIALNACKKDSIEATSANSAKESNVSENLTAEEGVLYTMDNVANGNNIMVFKRAANGSLSSSAVFPTGGKGTGAGLGSQGAITINDHLLFACNAGSNEITVFKRNGLALEWIDKISSYGTTPISLTVYNDLLYVVNAGGSGNISGFRVHDDGHLSHIIHSRRNLSTDTSGPAQIEFNNAGTQLVVTEKMTNRIVTYNVRPNGLTDPFVVHPSAGATPFGFEFGKHNELIVSDAFGGAVDASAVSSYRLNNNGNLSLITGPAATHQTAACWVAVTKDGHYCYATNTGSNSISGYRITDEGAIKLIDANGVTAATGTTPIDMAMSRESQYLYNLNAGSGSVSAYKVNNNGGLTSLGEVSGIPAGASGLAAR
jgi:6-phosphogluconolactonase